MNTAYQEQFKEIFNTIFPSKDSQEALDGMLQLLMNLHIRLKTIEENKNL